MNNYKLIIFDFDGTLCATHAAVFFCIKKAYATLGKTVPDIDFNAQAAFRDGLEMESIFAMLSPELSKVDIKKLRNTYEAIYLKEGEQKSATFPDAKQVLEKLYFAGYILTVVSNKAIAAVTQALHNFVLEQYIAMVIGDTATLRKKPDPMAYENFIKVKFPLISPREILVVGDTVADILFAQNIGSDACWAEYGYGNAKSCLALKPSHTIKNLTAILSILL